MINPTMGQLGAVALPADAVRAGQTAYLIAGLLFNYAAQRNNIEIVGQDASEATTLSKLSLIM